MKYQEIKQVHLEMYANLLIPLLLIVSFTCNALGQYQYDRSMTSGYSGGGGDYGTDGSSERSKVQLGLRVKIPSMKFELPRFSLPKITVSAKIRQPDRPRVINLPEINLDTTSSNTANHGYSDGDRYQQTGYQQNNHDDGYLNNNQREQTFSFTTHETEAPIASYGDGSKYYKSNSNNYKNNYNTMSQQQMKQAVYSSSTNTQPFYEVPNQATFESQQQINHKDFRHPQAHYYDSSRHTDLGFESPIYVRPNDKQEPIEAYGRYPIGAMAFHPNPGGSSFQVPRDEQAVLVSNKFRLMRHH